MNDLRLDLFCPPQVIFQMNPITAVQKIPERKRGQYLILD